MSRYVVMTRAHYFTDPTGESSYLSAPRPPLSENWLIRAVVADTRFCFGIRILVIAVGLAQLLEVPRAVYMGNAGQGSGLGMRFGYSSTTPPAAKCFPAARMGLIAGLVDRTNAPRLCRRGGKV